MQVWSHAITERLTTKRTKMLKNAPTLDEVDETLPLACLANVTLPSSSGASSSTCVAGERTKSDQKDDRKKAAMKASLNKFFQKVAKVQS